MSDCTHCWHTPSFTNTIAMYPPHKQEVCCHCGTQQNVPIPQSPIPEGHGKFYPQSPVTYTVWNADIATNFNRGAQGE